MNLVEKKNENCISIWLRDYFATAGEINDTIADLEEVENVLNTVSVKI